MKTSDPVAIIGPGLTGASLAALFAGHGFPTTMLALDEADAAAGLNRMQTCYADLVAQGLLTSAQAEACARRVTVTLDYADIRDAALIYECVYENADIKRGVYALIERHCTRYHALLSATSAILPDELACELEDRTRFLVAHPWNPPHMVPCVEIAQCAQTSGAALAYTKDILQYTGRAPIVMHKPAAGFIGNRLQHALYREAVYMVETGIATPEDIDNAILTSFGPRFASVGLFEHFDNVGLHVVRDIENYLLPDLCADKQAGSILTKRIAENALGIRTGKGMRAWTDGSAQDFRRRAAAPYKVFFNWKIPED